MCLICGGLRSAAQPQPNGVRPSSGAETSDGNTCGSNPEPQTSLKLLRPGTAALQKFIATCEQFPRLQCSGCAGTGGEGPFQLAVAGVAAAAWDKPRSGGPQAVPARNAWGAAQHGNTSGGWEASNLLRTETVRGPLAGARRSRRFDMGSERELRVVANLLRDPVLKRAKARAPVFSDRGVAHSAACRQPRWVSGFLKRFWLASLLRFETSRAPAVQPDFIVSGIPRPT